MAKKPKVVSNLTACDNPEPQIINRDSIEYVNSTSLDYSMGTLDRCIVGIDGLKSSQRKAIFTLSKITGEIKTIACAGKMISDDIYVHGESSASGTLEQLASPVMNLLPLIGKRGAFGTPANPNPASPRYTYVKQNKATKEIILVDKDIIPMTENYDGSRLEPLFYLPIIPVSLMNKTSQPATGYKPELLNYDHIDIIDNCLRVIKGKKQKPMLPVFTSFGASSKVIKVEDGKYLTFGKASVIDASTVSIRGFPVGLSLEKFKLRLFSMIDDGKVRSFSDKTSKEINITVRLPRGTSKNWTEDDVIDYFKLSATIKESLIMLDENNRIKIYSSTEEVIEYYINFRFGYYIKRYENLLEMERKKLMELELIEECFNKSLPSKLKNLKNTTELVNLITSYNKKINAPVETITKITNFGISRWTSDSYDNVLKQIQESNTLINTYNNYLNDHSLIWDIYVSELERLKTIKFDD